MKRIVILFVVLVCLVMTTCEDNASVGVIGGADGPTSIIVGEKDNNKANKKTHKKANEKKEPIRIVNVNGELYYDIDEESDYEARCGVMDGNFTKTVELFEIPKNDGESNFSEGSGYLIGKIKNTMEIPIGDDWEIFKKIDTKSDVLKYKYCYVVEGVLPNAYDDSELLVLADTMDISFNDASYQILGSDTSKMKDIFVLPIVD